MLLSVGAVAEACADDGEERTDAELFRLLTTVLDRCAELRAEQTAASPRRLLAG